MMEPYNENESGASEVSKGQVLGAALGVASKKEGEIISELTVLNNACSKLAEDIERLEGRLKPILRIIPPQQEESVRKEEEMGVGMNTEIGRIVKEQRGIIDYQIGKIAEIAQRIEL